jgi:hypothetical protein
MRDDGGVTIDQNLFGGPPPTYLPENDDALALLVDGVAPTEVAAAHPTYSLAWALLAEQSLAEGQVITGYAYARTGYHRGLDALRRAGWKGHGPIPWEHEPNRGFLRSLDALRRAAESIGEEDEAVRCAVFLRESSPEAAEALGA